MFIAITAFLTVIPATPAGNGFSAWPQRYQCGVTQTVGTKTHEIYSQICELDKLEDYKDRADSTAICIGMAFVNAGMEVTIIDTSGTIVRESK